MACLLTTGRTEPCKDAVGGLKSIYFFDFIEDSFTITAGEATAMNVSVTEAFKYDLLSDDNNFEEVGTSDQTTGTYTVAQTLTASLKKQDGATANEINLLSKARPVAVVRDRMDNYKVIGISDGLVVSGTGSSGGEKASFNGYTLTCTATEIAFAPALDATALAAFEAIVSATVINP
jgi:hypothetical protein